ncbi:hypothetical protein Barb6_02419 [Bacteroidales bacterium Barb6]|nr:hypothetical protein Barb6_02419 [Bacteroidales bacterium Barb6]
MNKCLIFLIALLISASGFAQQQGKQSVFTVQGHPHELLTKRLQEGKLKKPHPKPPIVGSTHDIDLEDIECWVGNPVDSLPIDSAVLLVKFTDGKRASLGRGDSILIWGYQWNTLTIPYPHYGVTKYSIDMIRAIANVDARFTALLQNTGAGNFVVGGFGYNYTPNDDEPVPVWFDIREASVDPFIRFSYYPPANCETGQLAVPYSPELLTQTAITAAAGAPCKARSGIINHPLNADYSYPAYDYDYWQLDQKPTNPDWEWQAGWNSGNWSFYTKDSLIGNFDYANAGIALRVLGNHSVDGFVFSPAYPLPANDMSGNYAPAFCICNQCLPQFPKRKR